MHGSHLKRFKKACIYPVMSSYCHRKFCSLWLMFWTILFWVCYNPGSVGHKHKLQQTTTTTTTTTTITTLPQAKYHGGKTEVASLSCLLVAKLPCTWVTWAFVQGFLFCQLQIWSNACFFGSISFHQTRWSLNSLTITIISEDVHQSTLFFWSWQNNKKKRF